MSGDKSKGEIIEQFNINTNMSVEELEKWLNNPKSQEAGTGVGIESGHKIVEILKKNPDKDPEKYDDEDIAHMRKVVGYDKRHMAQEDKLKETKTKEELENTKSTKSLRNWGHDPIKTLDGKEGESEGTEDNAPAEEKDEPAKGGTKRKHDDKEDQDAEGECEEEGDAGDAEKPIKKTKTDAEDADAAAKENEEDEV